MSTNGRDQFLPLVSGKGAEYAGWQESLPSLAKRLRRTIQGVKERLATPDETTFFWPSAVGGVKVFEPESAVVQVDTAQTHLTTHPCNFVVRSGKTYPIRIIHPGPGVFAGRWLKVAMYMRLHNPNLLGDNEEWLPIVSNTSVSAARPFTTRFCVYPAAPGLPANVPALNFWWNMQDPRTGRNYADRLLDGMQLLPRTWQGGSGGSINYTLPDGDLYEFKRPWVMERDGQLTFSFRPTTDFLQFDSSISGTNPLLNLPFDDREGGKRNQSVKVQVELHGYRFETMQDAIHAGALTHKW